MKNKLLNILMILFLLICISLSISLTGLGCTLIGVTGQKSNNNTYIGQTMDNPWWPTRHTLFVFEPEDGYKYIGTKADIWGVCTGLNSQGFGLAGSAISTTESLDPNGDTTMYNFGPDLLKSCANVDEAIEMIKKMKMGDPMWARNLIIADAEGTVALVEIGFQNINVETLSKDGYVVRTNFWLSDKMAEWFEGTTCADNCIRYQRGLEWFESVKSRSTIHIEDTFDYFTYVYQPLLNDPIFGPGTGCVIEPKRGLYWFTYGWPGGNLPTKELENRQLNQNMTWGAWIPFNLKELPPGQYTTEIGHLTPLAIQYLCSHFSSELQSSPNWLKYQSVDPMKPFYKPAEDIISPDANSPKKNPYAPAGKYGTWSEEEGFISAQQ